MARCNSFDDDVFTEELQKKASLINPSGAVTPSAVQPTIPQLFGALKKPEPPFPFVINSLEILARVEPEVVRATCTFYVSVLRNAPLIVCELLPSSIALEDFSIQFTDPPAAPKKAHLAVLRNQHCLLAPAGHYTVVLKTLLGFTTNLRQATQIQIPHATRTVLDFTHPLPSMTIVVTPSLKVTNLGEANCSRVQCVLPASTETLTVKWTKVKHAESVLEQLVRTESQQAQQKEERKVAAKEMVVTSGQDIVHAIGGGVVSTEASLHYTISNGSVASFEILIDEMHGSCSQKMTEKQLTASKRARVLSVEGQGLKKWEVSDDVANPRGQLLRLLMDAEVEGIVHFRVLCEMEMVSTSAYVALPTFTPLNVNRVKGNIAIQARTTVEINEEFVRNASKADVQELPESLRRSNVLHAYKFLIPNYRLQLQVTKHSDVDVLIAVVEDGMLEITHTLSHVLYTVKYKIRNTQLQYARLRLPDRECVIWSAVVDGQTVKPASDPEGQILLPLVKGKEGLFNAEVVFVRPIVDMAPAGLAHLELGLPSVDIPINRLFVEVYLPEDFEFDEWVGDLREVQSWTIGYPSFHDTNSRFNEEVFYNQDMDDHYRRTSICLQEQCEKLSPVMDMPVSRSAGSHMAAGIKPLKVNMGGMKVGQVFRFEKLLVNAKDNLQMAVVYKAKPPRKRRDINKRCCTIM